MNFNWDGFTEIDFTDHCAKAENDMYDGDNNYIGCIKVGGILFEVIVNESEELAFDMFITNENESIFVNTAIPFDDLRVYMSYDDFVEDVEDELERLIYYNTDTIDGVSLVDKAENTLYEW